MRLPKTVEADGNRLPYAGQVFPTSPRGLNLMRMRLRLAAALVALSAGPALAATLNLTIVHDSKHPTTLLEAAPTGSATWQPLAGFDLPRAGRVTHKAAIFPDATCVVDLRLTYADDPPITVSGWDLCRHPTVRLAQVRRKALEGRDQGALSP